MFTCVSVTVFLSSDLTSLLRLLLLLLSPPNSSCITQHTSRKIFADFGERDRRGERREEMEKNLAEIMIYTFFFFVVVAVSDFVFVVPLSSLLAISKHLLPAHPAPG